MNSAVPWKEVVPQIIQKYFYVRCTNISWKLVSNFNTFEFIDISDFLMLHFDAIYEFIIIPSRVIMNIWMSR